MGKHLTESEYTAIKQLLSKGYEGKKVAEIMRRGTGTVSTVKNSASYEDYQKKIIRQLVTPKKQTELPLDKPKKTTLDLRQELAIKFNELLDIVETMKATRRYTSTGALDLRKEIAFSRAKVHLEEARLWLKETF